VTERRFPCRRVSRKDRRVRAPRREALGEMSSGPSRPGVVGARRTISRTWISRFPLPPDRDLGVSGSERRASPSSSALRGRPAPLRGDLSAYARQFLERLDRPRIDRIEGIPRPIAIRQVNPIKTARSTVATLTELAEYVKLVSPGSGCFTADVRT